MSYIPLTHNIATTIPSRSTDFKQSSLSYQKFPVAQPVATPTYPSYLKDTYYAKLVTEQHKYFEHKYNKTITSTHKPDQLSNSTQYNDRVYSISPMEEEDFEELDLRLPTCWNIRDKSKNIEVKNNGLDLVYTGPGEHENHAALVRSNFPMRPQCGIFYYEMKVKSKGVEGYIGIGFCLETNKVDRLPGWDSNSWGYHGDDGHSFAGSGSGKTYGPRFTTGDVIGCGLNFANGSAFYTKNGIFVGTAFKDINLNEPLFPAVGLRTLGEKITTNFGHEPFVFDIAQYMKEQKLSLIKESLISPKLASLNSTKSPRDFYLKTTDQLILSYLIHHGYTNTAQAVVQNINYLFGQEIFVSNKAISPAIEKDLAERQLIRSTILCGEIKEAINLINFYFPGVLEEEGRGQELNLQLKCGVFIEMMREYCNRKNQSHKNTINNIISTLNIGDTNKSLDSDDTHSSQDSIKSLPLENTDTTSKKDILCKNNESNTQNHVYTSLGLDLENHDTDSLQRLVQYGKHLKEEYRFSTDKKTVSNLIEIFSLLAYSDPYDSPVSYLMEISRRDTLATEANATILSFQHYPEIPALECIYRQTIVCNKELSKRGDGKASLFNIEEDYINNTKHLKS